MEIDPPSGSKPSPIAYIDSQLASAPEELKGWWAKIKDQYERKLWHNLTVTLTQFVFLPGTGPYQIELFDKFITTIESKINALKLVEISRRVGREYSEPDLTLKFLQSVHSRLQNPYPVEATADTPAQDAPPPPAASAYALSLSSIAYAQLLLGDLPTCKVSLDETEKILSEQDSVEPVVNAGYYGVAGDYYKVKADYGPYYKNALLYLACVDLKTEMGDDDKKSRAHDLCVAALLGENIYNFGELLQHPILQTLVGTEYEWIKSMISAFNAGEIGKFESLCNNLSNEPILESSISFLRQKICLMALIQTVFVRPRDGSSRLMTFQSIGEATRLPVHEVEHLLMKALSLNLIKGTLDQVDGTADITWVQPRVLEGKQLDTLAKQFKVWCDGVGRTEKRVEEQAKAAKNAVLAQ